MSEALNVAGELTRKALDHLEDSYLALERGKIGMLEYKTIVETLFAICSGITDREFFEIITEAVKEIHPDHSFLEYQIFENKNDDGYLIIRRKESTSAEIISFKVKGRKVIDMGNEATCSEINEKLGKVIKNVKAKGFGERKL